MNKTKTNLSINIPNALLNDLKKGFTLVKSVSHEMAGEISICSLNELEILYFPTDIDNSDEIDNSKDPHVNENGCYLVPAINLVKSSKNTKALNKDAIGLVIWLPVEKKFGIWEGSENIIYIVKKASWTKIKNNMQSYIDLVYGSNNEFRRSPLIPWKKHLFSIKQIYSPLKPNKLPVYKDKKRQPQVSYPGDVNKKDNFFGKLKLLMRNGKVNIWYTKKRPKNIPNEINVGIQITGNEPSIEHVSEYQAIINNIDNLYRSGIVLLTQECIDWYGKKQKLHKDFRKQFKLTSIEFLDKRTKNKEWPIDYYLSFMPIKDNDVNFMMYFKNGKVWKTEHRCL